jgi:hypothetical protein
MKLFTTPATTLVFTLPTLACLRVHGGITHDPLPGLSGIYGVEAIDNGLVVCSVGMGSRIDQDGHYSLWVLNISKQDSLQSLALVLHLSQVTTLIHVSLFCVI